MLDYELVNIWESLYDLIIEWIESVILEGWSLYQDHRRIHEVSQVLVDRISLALSQDFHIEEQKVSDLAVKFHPVIYNWIDMILRIRWDFYRQEKKFTEYSILIARDLIKIFLDSVKPLKRKVR